MRLLRYAFFLSIISAAAWWFAASDFNPSKTETPITETSSEEPDYTINGLSVSLYDASGRPTQSLNGDRLTHFPASQHYEIDQGHGVIFSDASASSQNNSLNVDWTIRSQRVKTDENFEKLQWLDGVTLKRTGETEVTLNTDSMTQFPVFHDIIGKDRVTIIQSDAAASLTNQVQANGFTANTKTEALELNGSVEAIYE